MTDQDTIFLLKPEGELEKIPHARYESEDLLQDLIDQYPELLVGEQIDSDRPPRWLMVKREAGIPSAESGVDRWAIDHILIDQIGRPTLVEVKRSTDTRIRREVVGQMLDYAANALKYWPKDRIREFAANQHGGLAELEARLHELLDDQDANIEEFWERVDRNLREGELRLLFVADEIPTELRRIIEFLNEHMPRVEVLGVEIRQYERQGTQVLVPRVIGQTESARQAKRSGKKKPSVTRSEFMAACGERSRHFFESLFDEIESRGFSASWNTTGFSVRVKRASGAMASIGYGVMPYYYGPDEVEPTFEIFLAYLSEADGREAFREAVMQLGHIRAHTDSTLRVDLSQAPSEDAKDVIGPVLELGERLKTSG